MLIVQKILFPLEEDIIRFIVVIPIWQHRLHLMMISARYVFCCRCGGGCPYNRIKRDTEDNNINVYPLIKGNLKNYLLNHCRIKQ